MSALRAAYADLVSRGEIRPDPAQESALASLVRLEAHLAEAGRRSLFRKSAAPRGVYFWGPVGRGKSMLMDLFFAIAPTEGKRRVHFQTFMAETHHRIGVWRRGDAAERKAVFGQAKGDDPIPPVAELIAREGRLLCFDELQVSDITDAMLLGRLFEALFARGVTLVATSNRPPDELYKDGLNRELFLPFIEMIRARLEVVAIKGPTDFRLDRLRGAKTYFSPLNPACEAAFEALWSELTDQAEKIGATLTVLGRKLMFPRAVGGFLHTSFPSLCGQALGSQDYLAIAERFHTVFLENVPVLTPQRRDEARRFVNLIDALYEADAKLVVLAEAEPDGLYPKGDGSFEFERTASRLHEMRSLDYLERARG
jgi:cell division protein ZapE